MIFYNPKTNITLDKKELSLKYNTCIPETTEEFEGWYKLYYEKTPEYNKYQNLKENDIILLDGKYTQTFSVESKSLEVIKDMKRNEVRQKFSDMESDAYVESSLGFKINANERANRDIEGLLKVLTNKNIDVAMFRDYDNEDHEISICDLKTMQLEILENGQYLYQQKWNHLKEIDKAEDEFVLMNMDITFDNLSFGV